MIPLRVPALAFWMAAGALSASCSRPQTAVAPSILLVTFDTTRADHIGCYGASEAETPNLDHLAASGARFENARSQVPLTLPSHASILTGLLPPRHGIRGNGLFRLRADVATLAEALKNRGYSTAAVVSSVVLDRTYGLSRGFDTYDDNQRVGDKRAFNYLERSAAQASEAAKRLLPGLAPPYFLWIHLYDPHRPWVAPAPYSERHPGRPYDAEIAYADAAFGEIWRAAAARAAGGLVVFAAADHGESLGEHGESRHGYTLHRGVLRVPLIVSGDGVPSGRVIDATVGLIDVAPTIAELAGTKLAGSDGSSLRALWSQPSGTRGTWSRDALWEETLHPLYESGWAPLRGLVTADWHLVDAPRPELYARKLDPDDRHDVAAANAPVVNELRGKLGALASALGDVAEPQPDIGDDPDDRERMAKLAALGYASAGSTSGHSGPRLDPKDGLPAFAAMEDAEDLFKQGRMREALDRLEPFTRSDPGNPRIWLAEGMVLRAMRRGPEALRSLERAATLDPRSESIGFAYAEMLGTAGDAVASRAQLSRILDRNPKMVEAALVLAASLDQAGETSEARSVLSRCYQAGVRDADLSLRLGEHLERAGEHEAASLRFAEALEIRPDDPDTLLASGRASLQAGDGSRAIERLTRCANGPRALDCRIELARAFVLGPRDLGRARSTLLSARELAETDAAREDVDRRLLALGQMEAGR